MTGIMMKKLLLLKITSITENALTVDMNGMFIAEKQVRTQYSIKDSDNNINGVALSGQLLFP